MSDPHSQQGFPMLQNFNSVLLQHQLSQGQQQQQPNQLDPNQARQQASTFNQQDRLWAQMQHPQAQFSRPQSTDMQNNQPTNQQMVDIMRQNAQARAQQQAAQGQPQHPAFAQLVGAQNQFPGQNNALATQGMANLNIPASMLANRAALMQNPTQEQMRQLELLNRGTVNGVANFNRMDGQLSHQSAMNPQSGQPPSSQNDIFTSPALASASPAAGQANALGVVRQGAGQQPRPTNRAELLERIRQCRDSLAASKKQFNDLSANRAGMPDTTFALQANRLRQDMVARESYYKRLCVMLQNLDVHNNAAMHANNLGNMVAMNGNQPNAAASAAAASQAWVNMHNNGRPMNMSQMGGSPANVQPSPSQVPSQATPPVHPAGLPPSSSTPLQQPQMMQPQFSGQRLSSPQQNEGQQQPQQPQQQQQTQQQITSQQARAIQFRPIVLEKSRFEEILHTFLRSKNMQIDASLLNVSGNIIDLYDLHRATQEVGGIQRVMQFDLWAVVGARMGYVQFPQVSETEPAKSGPVIAEALKTLYSRYLLNIDKAMMAQMLNARQRMQQTGQPMASNAARMMELASLPAAQLRAQGIPEQTIQLIEQNRAQLLRSQEQQKAMFRARLQGSQQPQQPTTAGPSTMTGGNEANAAAAATAAGMPVNAPNAAVQPGANNGYGFRAPNQMGNPTQPNMVAARNMMQASNQERIDLLQNSQSMIQRLKMEASRGQSIPQQSTHEVPHEQRHQFNSHIEFLYNIVMDIDQKLPLVACIGLPEDKIRQLVSLIILIVQQRAGLSVNPPRYICDLPSLQRCKTQLSNAKEYIDRLFLSYHQQQIKMRPAEQQQPQPQPQPQPPPQPQQPEATMQPPVTAPQQQQQQPQPESLIPNRPVTLQPPPLPRSKKVASASSPASHATPPANTPTPIASASSPVNPDTSQGTPKSPKLKPPPKRAPVRRRPSKAQPPSTLPLASSSSQQGSPSQAKRQREDETVQPAVDSPSPKRPKTEEQQQQLQPPPPQQVNPTFPSSIPNPLPEPEPTIKQEDVDKINTEEDASEFLQNLTDLLEQAGALNEGLNADISEKLDDILRSVPPTGDPIFRPFSEIPEATSSTSGAGQQNAFPDEFIDYFDFSSFPQDEDDAGSKAATPDLVSSSSTNPSPESGSETEATTHGVAASNEVALGDNTADLLRLGIWKDIDGGESAYFTGTQGDWKWDKPMPAVEQAWAISMSS